MINVEIRIIGLRKILDWSAAVRTLILPTLNPVFNTLRVEVMPLIALKLSYDLRLLIFIQANYTLLIMLELFLFISYSAE